MLAVLFSTITIHVFAGILARLQTCSFFADPISLQYSIGSESHLQYQPQVTITLMHWAQHLPIFSDFTSSNLWVSSCAGQPCAGPSACLACGTWRYRWAPTTPARQWSCSSCPDGASRSGCEPLCRGKKHQTLTDIILTIQRLFSSLPTLLA